MTLVEYTLLAASSLFVIVDPIAVVPAFLAMTPGNTVAERTRMARTASVVSGLVLLLFAVVGNWLFRLLGITIPAFQMAGSVVLLLVALDMVRARVSRVRQTQAEQDAGAEKDDIAITPLAVPMLAGPGAISTVILLHARADDLPKRVALGLAIVVVVAACYAVLALAARGTRWMSPIAMRVAERIMGLLLAAIAFQFLINALTELGIVPRAAGS
jgi:multiple antibiotic resistance protein